MTVDLTKEEVQSLSEAITAYWQNGAVRSPQSAAGIMKASQKLQAAWDASSENGNGAQQEEVEINRA